MATTTVNIKLDPGEHRTMVTELEEQAARLEKEARKDDTKRLASERRSLMGRAVALRDLLAKL